MSRFTQTKYVGGWERRDGERIIRGGAERRRGRGAERKGQWQRAKGGGEGREEGRRDETRWERNIGCFFFFHFFTIYY